MDHVTLFTPAASSTLPTLTEASGVYQLQSIDTEQTYYVSHAVDLSHFYVHRGGLDCDVGKIKSIEVEARHFLTIRAQYSHHILTFRCSALL